MNHPSSVRTFNDFRFSYFAIFKKSFSSFNFITFLNDITYYFSKSNFCKGKFKKKNLDMKTRFCKRQFLKSFSITNDMTVSKDSCNVLKNKRKENVRLLPVF